MENFSEPAGFHQNRRTPASAKDAASLINMAKTYSEMTADERLADRIAKNREMERRIQETKSAATAPAEVRGRSKAVSDTLKEFQRIKKTQGIDAASEFVRSKSETPRE